MSPERKCQQSDSDPCGGSVGSALAKNQKQKRTDQKNRTTERIKTQERKIGRISKTFEQHFVHVPGDSVKREKSVLVPGLLQNVGDVRVAKIEDRVEAGVIVKGGEQTESGGNNQKADEHSRFLARLLHECFPIFGVGSDSPDQKINKDREAKRQFGAIAERESKKCSRQKRPKFNQNKIQSRYLAE